MNNHEVLIEKLNKEIESFRNSYNNFDVLQTYNDWYIIGFYEEYFDMLSCNFLDNHNVDEELEWLAEKDKPLEYLYEQWESCDGAFSHNWDEMLDWVRLVYREEKGLEAEKVSSLDNKIQSAAVRVENQNNAEVKDVLNR